MRTYGKHEVPVEFRAKLLLPVLTAQAKSIVSQLKAEEMSDIEHIKKIPEARV